MMIDGSGPGERFGMTVSLNSYGDKLVATGFYGSAPHAGVLRVYRSPAPGRLGSRWGPLSTAMVGMGGGIWRRDELVGRQIGDDII
jgi:hypothetical protein